MIYLDNAAATCMASEVLDSMLPYLTREYGNAGSLHSLGRKAHTAVQTARAQVAALLHSRAEQVVFTSGASESNAMVFGGLRRRLLANGKRHLVISAIEHNSVRRAAEQLSQDGFSITFVYPDQSGCICANAVEAALRPDTGLVSVMYVNNETGAVNAAADIGAVCRRHGILFHTDCVQAAGQFEIDVNKLCADFLSLSAHKIHGPKGVGALYLRRPSIAPLICGGAGQEFGLRGGTEPVAGIVGFGAAAQAASKHLCQNINTVSSYKKQFYRALHSALEKADICPDIVRINGPSIDQPGKILNLQVRGVDAQTLVLALDAAGVCISAGSACKSHEAAPSHVLIAMGLSAEQAKSSVRISFSKYNTPQDVLRAAEKMALCIESLLRPCC